MVSSDVIAKDFLDDDSVSLIHIFNGQRRLLCIGITHMLQPTILLPSMWSLDWTEINHLSMQVYLCILQLLWLLSNTVDTMSNVLEDIFDSKGCSLWQREKLSPLVFNQMLE